jgi:2'-5' RNA ligase
MRLFIAIPISVEIEQNLIATVQQLRRHGEELRWQSPESWHITLQFLGSSTQQQYDCLVNELNGIHLRPVPISIMGLGSFERAGALFVEVQHTPELLELQRTVLAATAPCGFEAESRPYSPHITLARRRGRSDRLRLEPIYTNRQLKPQIFTATEFLLYESHLGPGGSWYEVRERFKLANSSEKNARKN